MPKTFIFPGQGSQYIGMAADLYDSLEKAKERYESASDILGFNLAEVSFKGPADKLSATQYTQPAIFIHSIILDEYLKVNGTHPIAVAGHSLGEFSALVSADVLPFEDALQIIKVRSHAMAQSGFIKPGSMAAIIGADSTQLKIICEQDGVVVPANINAPAQVVISGETQAIKSAIKVAKGIGIRRAFQLNVSGAFHSPFMSPARDALKEVINSVNFQDAKVPIYQNFTANSVTCKNIIRQNILNQLENPVLWLDTIKNIFDKEICEFIEVGPGKVLRGINRQINKNIITYNVDKIEDLDTCEIL